MIQQVQTQITSFLSRLNTHWQKGVDLGCGTGAAAHIIQKYTSYLTGVDYNKTELAQAQNKGYNELILSDIRTYTLPVYTDVVFLFDVIEHLYHNEGEQLLKNLNAVPNVILTTPGRFWEDAGKGQRHLSLWTADELRSFGYIVELFYLRTLWFISTPMLLAYRLRG